MLRSFSEKIFTTKIGKTKITQRLTSFLISCLCLERVVELSLFSFVNLDSIILLWIVFLIRQISSLCLLKSSSKIWVFTSVPFFHKVGEEPINRINWPPMLLGLPNQLINSISPGCTSNISAASHSWSKIKCETKDHQKLKVNCSSRKGNHQRGGLSRAHSP